MKRRGRALARRYGRAGFRIGAGGLEKPKAIRLTPGHIYAMGASSSPSLIIVDSIAGDAIRYRNRSGDQAEKRIERWIGEDLIAQGEATFAARYGVSPTTWIGMNEAQRREQLRKTGALG
jgi:hypothetical protein